MTRSRWWDGLLDALFPPRCVGCGARGEWLCRGCYKSVRRPAPPLCRRCGREYSGPALCADCRLHPFRIDGIRSGGYYEGALRAAALRFKHSRHLAAPLGTLLGEAWSAWPRNADLIVPVPLHPSRLRERGYNQAALLARELAEGCRLALAEDCLARTRATAPQTGHSWRERWENVAGAFACQDPRVVGRGIILVDDVCTTGATLEACARALKDAGAKAVWGLVVARAG